MDFRGTVSEHMLTQLASIFSIHPVALAAISVNQRVKTHVFPNHQLYITRALLPADYPLEFGPASQVFWEQVCVFTGVNYILTFQERYHELLEPVRQRIRFGFGPVRKKGPDFLTYSIVDTIMDGYFAILEDYADRLSVLEVEVLKRPHPPTLKSINEVKRDLRFLHQIVSPQRHALKVLIRGDSEFVTESCRSFYRDAFETTVELTGILDGFRDFSSSLMHAYLLSLGQKTNEIMKLLTLISAIFVPITFVTGVYGMNFENIPEIHFQNGYYVCWSLMMLVALMMLFYFFRRGWLWEDWSYLLQQRSKAPENVSSRRNSLHGRLGVN